MRVVAEFGVFGVAPAPWRAPTVTRKGRPFKDKHLLAWQAYLREVAEDFKPEEVPTGPLHLDLTFLRRTPVGRRHGEPWCPVVSLNPKLGKFTKKGAPSPDLANLFKGFEDALENVFYENDVQTTSATLRRLYGPREGVRVIVSELEPADFDVVGDPVDG